MSPLKISQNCVKKRCCPPEIPRSQSKTPVLQNFFLIIEFPLAFQLIPGISTCYFLIPMEIPCPQLPCLILFVFFRNSPMNGTNSNKSKTTLHIIRHPYIQLNKIYQLTVRYLTESNKEKYISDLPKYQNAPCQSQT